MRRKQEPEKYCKTCGRQLIRKRFNGRLEDLTAFRKRKYCSLTCANTKKVVTEAGLRWRAEQLRKEGINKFLGTNFTQDEMMEIYTYLGNYCNHQKTLRFIKSGFDLDVFTEVSK